MTKAQKSEKKHSTVKSLEKDLATAVVDINQKFDKMFELMKTNLAVKAKDRPASITKDGTHSEDIYQHKDEGNINFATKNGEVEVVREGLSAVDTAEFTEKADQLRFDRQEIEVMVMPSQTTYPDHTFTVGVNGRLRLIVRGTRQWLPRCYVEVLLRAKISSYGNFESRNHMTNELGVQNPETKSHRYPLQILSDPSGVLGAKWLERVTNDMRA